MIADDPTWGGLLRGFLVLAAIWWAWAAYAWLTNTLNPEEGIVRIAMFGVMAAMLIAALAVPEAFGEHGVVFGVAYLVVREMHLALYALAARGDHDLAGAVWRFSPSTTICGVLILTAGFLEGDARIALWVIALAVDYLGAIVGRGAGWRLSPGHFAERHGLIVIIAIGESIVALGIGAAGTPLSARCDRSGAPRVHCRGRALVDLLRLGLDRRRAAVGAPDGRAAGKPRARRLQLPPLPDGRRHRPLRGQHEEDARRLRRAPRAGASRGPLRRAGALPARAHPPSPSHRSRRRHDGELLAQVRARSTAGDDCAPRILADCRRRAGSRSARCRCRHLRRVGRLRSDPLPRAALGDPAWRDSHGGDDVPPPRVRASR